MALTIGQMASVSYEAVLNQNRRPSNQWADSTFLNELERMGAIKKVAMGPTLEHTIDYRRNPGADIMASDLTPHSLAKVEVLSALSFSPAEIVVPLVWSQGDETKNPTENQKIAFVKNLLENGIQSHDDLLEEALFASSTDGFLGLATIVPDAGEGNVGGVDAAVETWHRNFNSTYTDDGANLLAKMAAAMNDAGKGSGGGQPQIIVTGADAHAIYEGELTPNKRFIATSDADGSFKKLAFRQAGVIFSQYGGTSFYFLNVKKDGFRLNVAKDAFRAKSDTIPLPNQTGFVQRIYTMAQVTTGNKSRNAILTQVAA